ncbi:MAG: hypothetical protein Q8R15_04960 [Candidatus Micrarchaeota archaeon]|nr:hypothetical protein [Candidatus Micrarchaeota archaeon]
MEASFMTKAHTFLNSSDGIALAHKHGVSVPSKPIIRNNGQYDAHEIMDVHAVIKKTASETPIGCIGIVNERLYAHHFAERTDPNLKRFADDLATKMGLLRGKDIS